MSRFDVTDTVGNMVARRPALSRVFEQAGIDYCCRGKQTVDEACRANGLDSGAFLARLNDACSGMDGCEVDVAAMSMAELADHIEQTHHTYLRAERPRLDRLAEKVASVHGAKDTRLRQMQDTLLALGEELFSHMMKEEQLLFPMVRDLERGRAVRLVPCGTLANPIAQMEHEHDEAGAALERLRDLTDGFTAPVWACNTHRALLDALAHFEHDMHEHIHKENNVLFPRALALEAEVQTWRSPRLPGR